jgi:hypothetical protein
MLMAIKAGKRGIVGRIGVTFWTIGPLILMFSRIYGEEQTIMFCEFSRLPIWLSRVTFHAVVGNSCGQVIWIGRVVVISLMAWKTLGWHIWKVSWIVALVAIIDGMSKGEGEFQMFIWCRFPTRHCGVALHAYVGDSCSRVIWIGCVVIVSLMAWKTLSWYVGIVRRIVAFIAIIDGMTLGKWEKGVIKLRRFPSGLGGMTLHTNGREVRLKVTRIGGCIIIFLVTGEAFCRNVCVVGPCVTLIAIKYGVTLGQGKKWVVVSWPPPGKWGHWVAIYTLGREIP